MAETSTRELVLRALAAAEIAESCSDADLQRSFYDLAEHWLASAAGEAPTEGPPPQLSA